MADRGHSAGPRFLKYKKQGHSQGGQGGFFELDGEDQLDGAPAAPPAPPGLLLVWRAAEVWGHQLSTVKRSGGGRHQWIAAKEVGASSTTVAKAAAAREKSQEGGREERGTGNGPAAAWRPLPALQAPRGALVVLWSVIDNTIFPGPSYR